MALDPGYLGGELVMRELVALVMKMDSIPEQHLHRARPGQGWISVHHGLQVAQLVRPAELQLLSRRFELSAETIALPNFRLVRIHNIFDYILAPIETDHMQNSFCGAKHPFPPIVATHPAAGFIAVDHGTLSNHLLNRFRRLDGLFTNPLHNSIDPTLADFNSVYIAQRQLGAFITHVLLLPVVNHRCFQPSAKGSFRLKSNRRLFYMHLFTTRTDHFVLADLNDFCLRFRQFGNLVYFHQPLSGLIQFAMAFLTFLRAQRDHMVRLCDELALMFFVSRRRSMSVLAPILRLVTLLVL